MSRAVRPSRVHVAAFTAAEVVLGVFVVVLAAMYLGAYAAGAALVGAFAVSCQVEKKVLR